MYGFERAHAAEWRHKSRSRKVMVGPEPSDGPLIHTQNAISDILSRFSCRADSDHTGEPPVRASGCRCVPPCHCVAVLGCAPSEILLDRVPVPCVRVCVTTYDLKPMRRESSHHEHSQRAGAAGIPAVSWMVNGSPRERGKEGAARKRPG